MKALVLLHRNITKLFIGQKERIEGYCETKGLTPRFVKFTDIEKVDLKGVKEEWIVFNDIGQISYNKKEIIDFLSMAEALNKKVVLRDIDIIIDSEFFKTNTAHALRSIFR